MRTILWWLFVAAACTPVTLMALIAAEARYPRLDTLTVHNPAAIRALVGEVAITWVGYGKDSAPALDRILRLAPENPEAWTRRCTQQTNADSGDAFAACTKAVALQPVQWNYSNLGLAQEKRHDPCAAEDSFNVASMKSSGKDAYSLRNFGRAALECGHLKAAVYNFEQAERRDAQEVAVASSKDEDDRQDDRDDLATDRDWLILAYGRNGSLRQAAVMCSTAHPTWHTCSCNTEANTVKCSDQTLPARPTPR